MEAHADAFLTLPGGIGTCEEFFEVWTAGSLGMHAKPVVLLDPDGHYDGLLRWLHGLGEGGFLHDGALRAGSRGARRGGRAGCVCSRSTVALTPTHLTLGSHRGSQNVQSGTRPRDVRSTCRHRRRAPRSFLDRGELMHHVTEKWFADRTFQEPAWTAAGLVAAKARAARVRRAARAERGGDGRRDRRRDRPADARRAPLVDELVVVDSGSTDRTIAVAAAAGARVVRRTDVVPQLPPLPGKGEVLWRSLAATTGDVIVLPRLRPRRLRPRVRPLAARPDPRAGRRAPGQGLLPAAAAAGDDRGGVARHGGGRVTELLARPLLAALRPELAGVVQPLGGEYAGTRELLESVPFACGYGVEIGLLLDTHARLGLGGAGAGQPGGAQAPQPQPAAAGCDVPADPRRRAAPLRVGGLGRPADPVRAGRGGVAADVDRGARDGAAAARMRELRSDPLH